MSSPDVGEVRAFAVRRHDLRLIPAVVASWIVSALGRHSELAMSGATVIAFVAVAVVIVAAVAGARLFGAARTLPRFVGPALLALVSMSAGVLRCALAVEAGIGLDGAHRGSAEETGEGSWALPGAVESMRSAFAAHSGVAPGPGSGLLAGLAVGDTSAVGDDLVASMRASSLSHLTAVSGANCLVATGAVMGVAGLFGLSARGRIAAGLLALLTFCVLVGDEVTVLRAATMLGAVLVLRLFGRTTGGLPVLSATVVGLLLITPALATDYAFALSVLATAGLIVLARPLSTALGTVMTRGLAEAIAIPCAAQFACMPVLILLGAQVSGGAVLANVLAAPAAPPATVIGVLGCLVAELVPPLSIAFVWLAWPLTAWIECVAQFFSAYPLLEIAWPSGVVGAGLAAGLAVVVIAAVASTRRTSTMVVSAALVTATVVTGATLGHAVAIEAAIPEDWVVAACDVGQGDGFVVRAGEDVMVVDTGTGELPLDDCLGRLDVDDIAVLSLSHWDGDHVGDAATIVRSHDVKTLLVATAPFDDPLVERLSAAVGRVEIAQYGDIGAVGGLRWQVLWPISVEGWSDNDASLVLRVDAGDVSILFLGDAGAAPGRRIAAELSEPVDIVKVAHHGSADLDPGLYRTARAHVGLIGVGADNGYGHPTHTALTALAEAGTAVFRTDRNGMIVLSTRADGTFGVWCESGCHPPPLE